MKSVLSPICLRALCEALFMFPSMNICVFYCFIWRICWFNLSVCYCSGIRLLLGPTWQDCTPDFYGKVAWARCGTCKIAIYLHNEVLTVAIYTHQDSSNSMVWLQLTLKLVVLKMGVGAPLGHKT